MLRPVGPVTGGRQAHALAWRSARARDTNPNRQIRAWCSASICRLQTDLDAQLDGSSVWTDQRIPSNVWRSNG